MIIAMRAIEQLEGKRFGRLTVKELLSERAKNGARRWLCLCECGNEVAVSAANLSSNQGHHTTSCGCKKREIRNSMGKLNLRHGHNRRGGRSPIYNCWAGMVNRCTQAQDTHWHRYGGRGIKVCDRWRAFDGFLEDMGPTWFKGATIDRIDNDGDYEPANCRWITRSENSRKRFSDRAEALETESRLMLAY